MWFSTSMLLPLLGVWICFHVCFRSPGSMVVYMAFQAPRTLVSQQRAWFSKLSQWIMLFVIHHCHPPWKYWIFVGYRDCSHSRKKSQQSDGIFHILSECSQYRRSKWLNYVWFIYLDIKITDRSNTIDMLFLELIPVEFFVDVEGVVILLCFFVGTISGNRELSLHIRQHFP